MNLESNFLISIITIWYTKIFDFLYHLFSYQCDDKIYKNKKNLNDKICKILKVEW